MANGRVVPKEVALLVPKQVAQNNLAVPEVIAWLDEQGPQLGFARETFAPVYLLYRILSGAATHTSINIYDWYLEGGGFWRTVHEPGSPSMHTYILHTSLYSTAFLAGWVLKDATHPSPVADSVRAWLEPDATGGRGWLPAG